MYIIKQWIYSDKPIGNMVLVLCDGKEYSANHRGSGWEQLSVSFPDADKVKVSFPYHAVIDPMGATIERKDATLPVSMS